MLQDYVSFPQGPYYENPQMKSASQTDFKKYCQYVMLKKKLLENASFLRKHRGFERPPGTVNTENGCSAPLS